MNKIVPPSEQDKETYYIYLLWATLNFLRENVTPQSVAVPSGKLRDYVISLVPEETADKKRSRADVRDMVIWALRDVCAIQPIGTGNKTRYFLVAGIGEALLAAYEEHLHSQQNGNGKE